VNESFSISRVEAFSDGVFAIAITLLILEIRVPAGTDDVGGALLDIWPSYLAYVTSFLTIGVIWVNHHSVFTLLTRVDRPLVFFNTLMLMVVAFIPFPTRLVAEFLREERGERDAALAYALTFVVLSLVFEVWWRWIATGRRLLKDDVPQATVDTITRSYNPATAIYGGAAAFAFLSPLASVAVCLALAAYFALPAALVTRRRAT
jgi:uncharacterized membrane protein